MRLTKGFLIASLLLFITAGCGEDDSNAVEVVEIVPESGVHGLSPKHDSRCGLIRQSYQVPVILHSATIHSNCHTPTYPTQSRGIDASHLYRYSEQAQLIVHDFQDVTGQIQAKAFRASYPVFIVDPGPAEIIGHQPSGSRVDPITTRAIRITLSRPINQVEFQIVPKLNGMLQIDNDRIQCESVVSWNFLTGEQLQAKTEYLVVVEFEDFVGNRNTEYFTFTTQ